MQENYPLIVRNNILPLSLANTLPEAFREWYFTDEVEDHEQADAECELCSKEELRYHFKIKNENTGHELWVGSKCILKFELLVYEDGKLLDEDKAKKKLANLTKKMQLDSCIKALEKLAASENNDILKGALEYYKREKHLTPKQAFVVFWRLQEKAIDHKPSFFKVHLKRDTHKKDLREMPTVRVHRFWTALTLAQRKMAEKMGHKPPS